MIQAIAGARVKDIPRREPVRVRVDSRLLDVVAAMRERRRGSVLIEDAGGKLRGIFTERDLMLRVDHGSRDWHDAPVSTAMTADVVTVGASASLAQALRKMIEGNFRHMPVVDGEGHAVGLVSIRDILAHVVEYFPQEFLNLPPDPEHEAHRRWGG